MALEQYRNNKIMLTSTHIFHQKEQQYQYLYEKDRAIQRCKHECNRSNSLL